MEATATPSTPSGATTTGPASFSELPSSAWSDASSASTPSTTGDPAASASADTTVPPATTTPAEGQPQQPGEPPKERWDAILANARTKAAEEALAPYAWAKQVNPQEFQQIQQIARHFAGGDTLSGIKALLAEARKDPAIDQQLRSEAARMLAQARQPQQPSGPDLTPIPVQLENGQVVQLHSAEQVEALKQQWLNDVRQEFQPVMKTVESVQQERAQAQRDHQIQQFVTTTFEDIKTWPGMDNPEARKAVAQELAAHGVSGDDHREVLLAVDRAYRKLVLPTLNQKAEAKLLDSLKTKAAASVSNPAAAAASAPRRVDRFSDLPPDAWR